MIAKVQIRAALPNTAAKNELKRALQQKIHEAKSKALVYQEALVLEIESEINELDPLSYLEVEKELFPLQELLSTQENAIKAQKKWLALGLPKEPLQTCPEAVSFLVESGFVFSCVMFQHGVQVDAQGMPLIKMRGAWTSWEKINEKVVYDPATEKVYSRGDVSRIWNYLSPAGLVDKNPASSTLYRIEKLDEKTLHLLQNNAKEFWNTHPEIDAGQEKPCTLQLMTSTKDYFKRNWLTNQINDYYPQHTTIRLIDSTGNVYSFGMQVTKEFEEHLANHSKDWLATGYAKMYQPDFEESRPFDERRVTSIPITNDRFQDIVAFVNEVNQDPGMRFCLLNQNCNTFGVAIAHLAGVDIDTKITVPEMIVGILPKMHFLSKIARCVRAVLSHIPTPVAYVVRMVTKTALYLPRKIITVVLITVSLFFGAHKEVVPLKQARIRSLAQFSKLITSFRDLFNEEKLVMYHSFKLVEWQMRHAHATKVYRYTGAPNFNIV